MINIREQQTLEYQRGYAAAKKVYERKKGKWITETINCYTKRTYCSVCNNKAPALFVSDDYYATRAHGEIKLTNYCPSCGADMRGEQDK